MGFNMLADAVDVTAALITWFRLVCSGDVELNPGPLSEQDLLAFTSLLSQSLTLADIVMTGMVGAHTEDSIGDKGQNNEKGGINQDEATTFSSAGDSQFSVFTPPSGSLNITDSPSSSDGIADVYSGIQEKLNDSPIPSEEDDSSLIVDLMIQLCQILSMLKELFLKASRPDQEVLAEQVKVDPDTFRVFYGLSFHLFEMTQGLSMNEELVQVYLLLNSNIEGWVDVSGSICSELATRGLLLQNINELEYIRTLSIENSEVMQSAVETHLSILYNCIRNHSLPEFYFSRIHWPEFLSVWSKSSNSGLRITCQLLASYLALFFPLDEESILFVMNTDDLSALVKALEIAAHSPDSTAEAFQYRYSAVELVDALCLLSHSTVNLSHIAKPELLIPLTTLIRRGKVEEKVSSLRLLWRILEDPEVKRYMTTSHEEDLQMIEKESVSENYDIRLWAKGVIVTATHNHRNDGDLAMVMGRCCFAYGSYDKCAQLCKELLALPEAELLRGKSLYHIYRSKQRKLRMCQVSMPQKDFHTEHKACYDLVKEVLKLLGRAVDNRKVLVDASINKMLDFAMLDYMLEANKLKDVGRCFLCLNREEEGVGSPISTKGEDSKQSLHEVEEVVNPIENKKSMKRIHASHLIPRSAIKRLANQDPVAEDKVSKNVLFGAFGTKLKDTVQRTPGTCTLYMLCTSCEHMLNVKGEQPFLRIFEKLYDPASHNEECEVLYGEELYHFCVGLIFRTLCPSQDDYINTAEVYQLLVNCRKFLMVDNPVHMVNDMPSIYFFICPTDEPDFDETMRLFMVENSASYTSKISLDCPLEALGTFESALANFFMIKLGIIIVVVKFSPVRSYDIPERFLVIPSGGSYSIPAREKRKGLLPLGIWTALNLLHQMYKDDLSKVNTSKKK